MKNNQKNYSFKNIDSVILTKPYILASIHQINHPGKELKISFRANSKHKGDYYFSFGSNIDGVRLWNRCYIDGKRNSHKRKFIEHRCKYVESPSDRSEKEGMLRFWGEY